MQYQACRWYDPYPRLAFALKLLYFSPKERQIYAARQISQLLDRYLGQTSGSRRFPKRPNNRWYDHSMDTAQLVERLKQSPDSLKNLFADKLIATLTHPALA